MRTRLTLHPEQDGAKQLRERYGDQLVCVHYRYDETRKERWKTVELSIAKRAWEPPKPRWSNDMLVALQVGVQECAVRQQVKAAGAGGILGGWAGNCPMGKWWPWGCGSGLSPRQRGGSKAAIYL